MRIEQVQLFALLFAALALVPSGAHLAELLNKIELGAEEYRTVQQIYRGWALFGIVVFGALFATLALTIKVRHEPRAFGPVALRTRLHRGHASHLLDVDVSRKRSHIELDGPAS